jgi:AraC-like DNA-binding protein
MVGHISTRLEEWRQISEEVCGRFSTQFSLSEALFVGDIHRERFGLTDVAFIRTNASQIVRARSNSDLAEDRFCFLVLQQQGSMEVSMGSERMVLREGDLALLDSAMPIEMVPNGLFKHLSVHLPREALRGLDKKAYGKLPSGGFSGQLLRSMMHQIASGDLSNQPGSDEGPALQNAILALLDPVVRFDASSDFPESLRSQAEQIIRQQLTCTNLTASSVAEQLNISSRHLYRIFESDSDTVCRFIQRLRLEKAALILREPALRHKTITDVAMDIGYPDPTHFSKAFRKRYGQSPREFKSSASQL